MRKRQALITGATLLTLFLGAPPAANALYSYNGDDHTNDYQDRTRIRTCDNESDSTGVKGVYELTNGDEDSVRDDDGNNGVCAHEGSGGRTISGHQTCETPDLWPDTCGNWQRY